MGSGAEQGGSFSREARGRWGWHLARRAWLSWRGLGVPAPAEEPAQEKGTQARDRQRQAGSPAWRREAGLCALRLALKPPEQQPGGGTVGEGGGPEGRGSSDPVPGCPADTPKERPLGNRGQVPLNTAGTDPASTGLHARHHPGQHQGPWRCAPDPGWARPCPPICHPQAFSSCPGSACPVQTARRPGGHGSSPGR